MELRFDTSGEMLDYLKEHSDSVEQALVYVFGFPEFTNAKTGQKRTLKDVGMTLVLCDGRKMNLPRQHAVELLNDGLLSRMRIKTVFY